MRTILPAVTMTALAAAVTVLAIMLLRERTEPKPAEVTGIDERLDAIAFDIGRLRERTDALASAKDLDLALERLDELASQIYEFERSNQKNLMTVQRNILRKIGSLELEPATRPKKDPRELKEDLRGQGLDLNVSAGFVRFRGTLVTPNRPLEVVAINEGGPAHEALLRTTAKPSGLRAALLALGAKPGSGADPTTGKQPDGTRLFIYVEWEGLKKPWRLENILKDTSTDLDMRHAKWVFAGSDFTTDFNTGAEFYIPDLTRVLIALVWKWSDSAVIALDHEKANDEYVWAPMTEIFPDRDEIDVTVSVALKPIEAWERETFGRDDEDTSSPDKDEEDRR